MNELIQVVRRHSVSILTAPTENKLFSNKLLKKKVQLKEKLAFPIIKLDHYL